MPPSGSGRDPLPYMTDPAWRRWDSLVISSPAVRRPAPAAGLVLAEVFTGRDTGRRNPENSDLPRRCRRGLPVESAPVGGVRRRLDRRFRGESVAIASPRMPSPPRGYTAIVPSARDRLLPPGCVFGLGPTPVIGPASFIKDAGGMHSRTGLPGITPGEISPMATG
jgi:hypothetical protein